MAWARMLEKALITAVWRVAVTMGGGMVAAVWDGWMECCRDGSLEREGGCGLGRE